MFKAGGRVMAQPNYRMATKHGRLFKNIQRYPQLYWMILPVIAYFIIFHYVPMYGIQIAFRDFYPGISITAAKWVGFENFERFFHTYMFPRVMINTLRISLMGLILGFPMPVLLALMLNYLPKHGLRRVLQMTSYAPYFISAISMAGILTIFLSERGIVNVLLRTLSGKSIDFLGKGSLFAWIYVIGNIWKNMGWNSIIYIAALAGIDPSLYESARIDGATKAQTILYIDIPLIMPTMTILLILNCGNLLSVGWEQILQMQNTLNLSHSEIISTYTYKIGLVSGEYSYSAAIGMFNSVINLIILMVVNTVSRKVGETSLW